MTKWKFRAKALPYDYTSLEPILSEQTLKFHHDKHYEGYLNRLQELIAQSQYEGLTLMDIVLNSEGAIFNNAAQALNHELYFEQLSPHPQSEPEGILLKAIEREFSSLSKLKQEMNRIAAAHFGSGWVWLTKDRGENMRIVATSNAHTPIADGEMVLLVIDLWEHAYYLDYQNNRAKYLEAFWDAIDWSAIQKRWANIPVTADEVTV